MRNIFLLLLFLLTVSSAVAQQDDLDSLKQVFHNSRNDSIRFALSLQVGEWYYYKNNDSALVYIQKGTALADQSGSALWLAHARVAMMGYFFATKDFVASLNLSLQNIDDYSSYNDPYVLAMSITLMAAVYGGNGYPEKAIASLQKVIAMVDTLHYVNSLHRIHFFNSKEKLLAGAYMNQGFDYLSLHKMDSALWSAQKAYEIDIKGQVYWNYPVYLLAGIYQSMGQADTALALYKTAVSLAMKERNLKDVVDSYNSIAALYKERSQTDSAIAYARKAIVLEREINYRGALEAALSLSEIYESQHRSDSALYYYKYAMGTKDSISNLTKVQQVQSIAFKGEIKEREQRQYALLQQTQYRNRVKIFIVLGVAVALLSVALILWRNNRHKQKANALLQRKNTQIEQTLAQLKATQAQLIQSEKMASLGELTAGIAHEIQNPLNFVNNFSEVNNELMNELVEEVNKKNYDEVKTIAVTILENEEKISQHGKRADAIVKNMLQHSRVSTGQKEPTDINALADEYLRLSYHGMRAKDKSFNPEIKTDFDNSIGKINIIPQDIGRVLLNLYNNAFYAVNEKKKTSDENYQPTISVQTKNLNDKVEIRVADNGNGIPSKVVDKIFQPFFTTKPTGQGTGLGLSLSYDIIKAHSGEIKVETKEDEGSEFIIHLPINNSL
jgi:signal transduction histidine kinase